MVLDGGPEPRTEPLYASVEFLANGEHRYRTLGPGAKLVHSHCGGLDLRERTANPCVDGPPIFRRLSPSVVHRRRCLLRRRPPDRFPLSSRHGDHHPFFESGVGATARCTSMRPCPAATRAAKEWRAPSPSSVQVFGAMKRRIRRPSSTHRRISRYKGNASTSQVSGAPPIQSRTSSIPGSPATSARCRYNGRVGTRESGPRSWQRSPRSSPASRSSVRKARASCRSSLAESYWVSKVSRQPWQAASHCLPQSRMWIESRNAGAA